MNNLYPNGKEIKPSRTKTIVNFLGTNGVREIVVYCIYGENHNAIGVSKSHNAKYGYTLQHPYTGLNIGGIRLLRNAKKIARELSEMKLFLPENPQQGYHLYLKDALIDLFERYAEPEDSIYGG